jgi:hypothetical protein
MGSNKDLSARDIMFRLRISSVGTALEGVQHGLHVSRVHLVQHSVSEGTPKGVTPYSLPAVSQARPETGPYPSDGYPANVCNSHSMEFRVWALQEV